MNRIILAKVPDGFKLGLIKPGGIYPISDPRQIIIIDATMIAMPEWWEAL